MLFQRCPAPARASRKTSGKRAPEKRAPPTMQAGASEEPVPRNASVRVRRRARHRDRFPRPHRAPALPLPLTRLLTLPLPLPLVLRSTRGGCQAPLKEFRTASCRGVAGGRQAPLPWAPMRTRLSGSARHVKGRNGEEQLEGFKGRVPGSRRSPAGRREAPSPSAVPRARTRAPENESERTGGRAVLENVPPTLRAGMCTFSRGAPSGIAI
jgi:hypothetical protein